MTDTAQPIELTSSEVSLILSALADKRVETTQYLSSYRESDTPRSEDTCCDYHRMRFDERISQKKSLEKRRDRTQQLIARFEDLERTLAHEGNPTA